jgi:hypothetical protein
MLDEVCRRPPKEYHGEANNRGRQADYDLPVLIVFILWETQCANEGNPTSKSSKPHYVLIFHAKGLRVSKMESVGIP